MKDIGLISIIIPIYNAEKYLSNCIRSIISQTYKNIEIICVNDGSTDRSLEVIESFRDKRIKILLQENCGVTEARKNGVKNSSGNWIVFSDADDLMPIRAIETLADNSEECAIVIGQVEFYGNFKWPYRKEDVIWTKKQSLKRIITGQMHCGPISKLFLKLLFDEKTFDIPADFVLGEDKIMNLNLVSNVSAGKKIRQIPDVVYTYIQRPTFHPSGVRNRYERMKFECSVLRNTSRKLVLLRKMLFVKECAKEFVKMVMRKQ